MPFENGVFKRVKNWVSDRNAGIKILASRHDEEDDNFANGLSQCMLRDGTSVPTANLPMANFKFTGVGKGTGPTDLATFGQLQERVSKNVKADFGAVGDGVANDTQKFLDAIASGTTRLYVPSGRYLLTQRLVLPSNFWLELAPDAILDYSTAGAPWENSGSSGLIYSSGTKGTAIAITRAVPEIHQSVPVNHAGVTISGGVATVPCAVAHGLTTGMLVHVSGQQFPLAANQQGFFSQPFQAGAPGDIPHTITVIDALTFSFPTAATVVPSSASYHVAANVLDIATGQGAGFAPGDIIEIDAGAFLIPGGPHRDGELTRVKWVTGDRLILDYAIQCPIALADSPVIRKVTPVQNIRITGGQLLGRGYEPSLALVYGQSGVRVELAQNIHIDGMRFHRVDQTALEYCSVLNSSVKKCIFTTGHEDEGGRLTGFIKIQYGIAVGCATRNMVIENCQFYALRHAVESGGTPANPGRSYNIHVDKCTFGGSWVSDIATHSTNGSMWVTNNSFSGRGTSINVRSGRLYAYNNEMSDCTRALDFFERPEHIEFEGNTIRNCQTDAIMASSSIMYRWPRVYVRNNQMYGGVRFYRQEAMTIAADDVWIEDNKIFECQQEAIRIIGGSTVGLRSRAFISGNTIVSPSLGSTGTFGIRLFNVVDTVVNGNTIRAGTSTTMIRGIYVDGANTTGSKFNGNTIIGGAALVYPIDVTVGDFTIDGLGYINDVYDAPSIAAGASDIRQVTVTGATAGDRLVSISHDLATDNLELSLVYFGAGFIRYRIKNVSATAFDPGLATYRIVWARKYK